MRLLIGTTNPGKVHQMTGALAGSGFDCVAIGEVLAVLPSVEEVGANAAEIAGLKAVAYHHAVREPVLSLDHWLWFDDVDAADQPRGLVRRVPGHPDGATDDELIDYYADLCRRHGGTLTARRELGVAVAGRRGLRTTSIEAIRTLVPTPSAVRRPGLPLACLQIDRDTGKYVSEHSDDEEVALWQRTYGDELATFVARAVQHLG